MAAVKTITKNGNSREESGTGPSGSRTAIWVNLANGTGKKMNGRKNEVETGTKEKWNAEGGGRGN